MDETFVNWDHGWMMKGMILANPITWKFIHVVNIIKFLGKFDYSSPFHQYFHVMEYVCSMTWNMVQFHSCDQFHPSINSSSTWTWMWMKFFHVINFIHILNKWTTPIPPKRVPLHESKRHWNSFHLAIVK